MRANVITDIRLNSFETMVMCAGHASPCEKKLAVGKSTLGKNQMLVTCLSKIIASRPEDEGSSKESQ